MKTIVSIQTDSIKLVGLSPLNTTLFRLEENKSTGNIVVKNYEPLPDQVKNEFDSFYRILHKLLVMTFQGGPADQTGEYLIEYNQQRQPVLLKSKDLKNQIRIEEYDPHGIPRRLHATHPKFEALVRISRYESTK